MGGGSVCYATGGGGGGVEHTGGRWCTGCAVRKVWGWGRGCDEQHQQQQQHLRGRQLQRLTLGHLREEAVPQLLQLPCAVPTSHTTPHTCNPLTQTHHCSASAWPAPPPAHPSSLLQLARTHQCPQCAAACSTSDLHQRHMSHVTCRCSWTTQLRVNTSHPATKRCSSGAHLPAAAPHLSPSAAASPPRSTVARTAWQQQC